jgi:hypothetical protein
MKPKQPTAEEVWSEIEKALSKIDGLIERLPAEERPRLWEHFERLVAQYMSLWMPALVQSMSAEAIAEIHAKVAASIGCDFVNHVFCRLKDIAKEAEQRVKDQVKVKPRMTARDDEIVRLRDEEKLDWKAILKRIRGNPNWAGGQGGRGVSKRALMAAYRRRKKHVVAAVVPPFATPADGSFALEQMHSSQKSGCEPAF